MHLLFLITAKMAKNIEKYVNIGKKEKNSTYDVCEWSLREKLTREIALFALHSSLISLSFFFLSFLLLFLLLFLFLSSFNARRFFMRFLPASSTLQINCMRNGSKQDDLMQHLYSSVSHAEQWALNRRKEREKKVANLPFLSFGWLSRSANEDALSNTIHGFSPTHA